MSYDGDGKLAPPGTTTWRVVLDVVMGGNTVHHELSDTRDHDYCRHCGPVYYDKHRRSAPPQFEYHTAHWVLPRAVLAVSAGDEQTVTCLDCILDLAPQVPARAGDGPTATLALRPGAWACHDGSWGYVVALTHGCYYVTLSMWRGEKTKVIRAGEVEAVSAERPSVAARQEAR